MAGRIELKYHIDYRLKELLLGRLLPYLEPAPYTDDQARYPIMSLYFDSPSLRFYDEKLEGENIRDKVRLRGYGFDWHGLDPVVLEIKHKIGPKIFKFRKKLGVFREEYFDPERWPVEGDPGGRAVAALAARYQLRPAVQILYQRETYESPFAPGLRVAFDSHLVALHPGERMHSELFDHPGRRCLPDTQFIFEIKSNGGLPPWALAAIRAGNLNVRSISKYVLGIEKLNLHKREIGVYA